MVSLIVAVSRNGVIGTNIPVPRLLWKLPADMAYFRQKTMGHPVIMGRISYLSVPPQYRPLCGRTTIVVTRNPEEHEHTRQFLGCQVVSTIDQALSHAKKQSTPGHDEIFVAGGGQIYEETLREANRIYLTRVHTDVEGEIRFPELKPREWRVSSRVNQEANEVNPIALTWVTYERIRTP